ncbi:MAG: hypothetical protein R3F17_05995 [Planctomycetota bacterium]
MQFLRQSQGIGGRQALPRGDDRVGGEAFEPGALHPFAGEAGRCDQGLHHIHLQPVPAPQGPKTLLHGLTGLFAQHPH